MCAAAPASLGQGNVQCAPANLDIDMYIFEVYLRLLSARVRVYAHDVYV